VRCQGGDGQAQLRAHGGAAAAVLHQHGHQGVAQGACSPRWQLFKVALHFGAQCLCGKVVCFHARRGCVQDVIGHLPGFNRLLEGLKPLVGLVFDRGVAVVQRL
jgi:hypothetical protein